MLDIIRSLYRFLRRALSDLPTAIGSNKLGVLFPLLPACIYFAITYFQQGWAAMKRDWLIASIVTVVSYSVLFAYCIIRNLYKEHKELAAKLGKKEKELQYLRDMPRWAGYESDQAWKNAIDEQNRLVNLGHSVDDLFTRLQVDALRTARDLEGLLEEYPRAEKG